MPCPSSSHVHLLALKVRYTLKEEEEGRSRQLIPSSIKRSLEPEYIFGYSRTYSLCNLPAVRYHTQEWRRRRRRRVETPKSSPRSAVREKPPTTICCCCDEVWDWGRQKGEVPVRCIALLSVRRWAIDRCIFDELLLLLLLQPRVHG